MMIQPNLITLSANNDLVDFMCHGRIYWMTRKRFEECEEVSRLLEQAVTLGADMAIIHHIFDESADLEEIRLRFRRWRTA